MIIGKINDIFAKSECLMYFCVEYNELSVTKRYKIRKNKNRFYGKTILCSLLKTLKT